MGRGREHPLHIEYVHIGACLSFIQDTLTEALLSHPRLRMERKVALVKALGKVIWIQNDLFAKWWYVSIPAPTQCRIEANALVVSIQS